MSLKPIDSKEDALNRVSAIVRRLTQHGNKRITVGDIMRASEGKGVNPNQVVRYVEGWNYRADREPPPDFEPETFAERGYTDATEIIG